MIEKIDDTKFGIVQVVDESQLYTLTGEGWRLIAVIMSGRVEYAQRQVPMPSGDHNYHSHHLVSADTPVAVPSARYLVGFDAAKAAEMRVEELTQARMQVGELERQYKTANNDLMKARGELNFKTEEVEKATKLRNEWYEKTQESQKQHRQMETDIAKLRNAIGEIRFKEILG